jgi:hypothetical protein
LPLAESDLVIGLWFIDLSGNTHYAFLFLQARVVFVRWMARRVPGTPWGAWRGRRGKHMTISGNGDGGGPDGGSFGVEGAPLHGHRATLEFPPELRRFEKVPNNTCY